MQRERDSLNREEEKEDKGKTTDRTRGGSETDSIQQNTTLRISPLCVIALRPLSRGAQCGALSPLGPVHKNTQFSLKAQWSHLQPSWWQGQPRWEEVGLK